MSSCGPQDADAYLEPCLKAYREVADLATSATREWPGIGWETMRSILEKGQVVLRDGVVLNTIVDEFALVILLPCEIIRQEIFKLRGADRI